MATKSKANVPCWERRWVTKEEAVGLLNLTMPEFDRFIAPSATMYIGKNYDIEQLHEIMEKKIQA